MPVRVIAAIYVSSHCLPHDGAHKFGPVLGVPFSQLAGVTVSDAQCPFHQLHVGKQWIEGSSKLVDFAEALSTVGPQRYCNVRYIKSEAHRAVSGVSSSNVGLC